MLLKPIYAIAHHRNRPDDVNNALTEGANAIECDVFYDDGQICIQHDAFEDGTPLPIFLECLRVIADHHGDRFALLIFDLKDNILMSS